jgi:hypothetical protein
MAYDTLLALQASVTKTATFNGTGVSLPFGNGINPLFARVLYSAATNASGSNSVSFTIDYSLDNGSTWAVASTAPIINLSTTAQAGEISIPVMFPTGARVLATPANALVRLSATFAGAGSTPTITYSCDGLGNATP